MVQHQGNLDAVLEALASPHRRRILERLGSGPAGAGEFASPLGMTVTGVLKHIRVLESAGLVHTSKDGRTRTCRLTPEPLDAASAWIDEQRLRWNQRLDRFERHLEEHT